jgi:hypothetical protein
MALNSPYAPEPVPVEAPTALAELKIQVSPDPPQVIAGAIKGPSGQAHHLITTCGVLGSVVAGIAGAVLTLRASPRLLAPAFAELALAATSATLIARRAPRAAGAAAAGSSPGSRARSRRPGDIITG